MGVEKLAQIVTAFGAQSDLLTRASALAEMAAAGFDVPEMVLRLDVAQRAQKLDVTLKNFGDKDFVNNSNQLMAQEIVKLAATGQSTKLPEAIQVLTGGKGNPLPKAFKKQSLIDLAPVGRARDALTAALASYS